MLSAGYNICIVCVQSAVRVESTSSTDAITNAGCLLYPSLMASDVERAETFTLLLVGSAKALEYDNLMSRV